MIILFLNSHFLNSKCLTSHFLMFNPACATWKQPPLVDTRSYVSLLYFVKRVRPKSTVTNHSHFAIQALFFPIASQIIYKFFTSSSSHHISTTLQYLTHNLFCATIYCQVTPTQSRGPGVEFLHSVRTTDHFIPNYFHLLTSFYSTTTLFSIDALSCFILVIRGHITSLLGPY